MIKKCCSLLIFVISTISVDKQMVIGDPSSLSLNSVTPYIINVSWVIGSTNHAGHIIELSIDDSNHFNVYSIVKGSINSASITSLPSEATKYNIRVRAYNTKGYSNYITSSIYSKPNCPHGLTATAFTDNQINIKWKVNSRHQDGTTIERSNNGLSGWTEIARVFGQDSTFTDSILKVSKYYYRVRAFKSDSFSPYTHVASINVTSGNSFIKSSNSMEISDYLTGDNSINNYYIDPSGSDHKGDGSIKNPWASLYKACSEVTAPNSIINVNAGTYLENKVCTLAREVNIKGVGDASHIKFNVAGNIYGVLLLDSPGSGFEGNQSISDLKMDGNNTARVGVGVHYRSKVIITHCTFINFLDKAIILNNSWRSNDESISSSENRIDNCIIDNCSGINGVHILGQTDMLIHNNMIKQTTRKYGLNGVNVFMSKCRNIKFYQNKSYKPDKEIPAKSFHLVSYDSRGGIEIYGNKFYGGGTQIDIAGMKNSKEKFQYSWWIHHNSFSANKKLPVSDGKSEGISFEGSNSDAIVGYNEFINLSGGIAIPIGQENKECKNLSIHYNLFKDIGYTDQNWGYFIYMYGFRKTSLIENIYIDNNVFYNGNVDAGIIAITTGMIKNLFIRNNIIQNTNCDKGNGWLSFSPVFTYPNKKGWVLDGKIDSVYVLNNIVFNNSNKNKIASGQPVTNLIYRNNLIKDPLFVKPGTDFHLKSNSPAIDAGKDVGLKKDFNGSPVVQKPDIGAFEYNIE